MKTLGMVGGIGPESTVEYYRLLIAGYRERVSDGSYPPLLINSIDVNKLLALVAQGKLRELVEYLLGSLQQLERAGAAFALLASNTPHIVFGEVSTRSPLPFDQHCASDLRFREISRPKETRPFRHTLHHASRLLSGNFREGGDRRDRSRLGGAELHPREIHK